MPISRLAEGSHLVSPLEGDLFELFHSVNLINNPYNFVKFNEELSMLSLSHLLECPIYMFLKVKVER